MTNIMDNQNRDQKDTEARILEAAESEFLQKGFAASRTTAIAEAAGVTHAMLHYYFRTKEKLFGKVIEEKLSSLARTFVISIDDDTSLTECVRQAIERHFDFVRSNPLLPKFLVSEVFSNDNLMQLLKENVGMIAANTIFNLQMKIDKAAANGECKEIDATTLVLDIVSLNVFPILAAPMVCKVKNLNTPSEFDEFLDSRREENVKIILSRLRL